MHCNAPSVISFSLFRFECCQICGYRLLLKSQDFSAAFEVGYSNQTCTKSIIYIRERSRNAPLGRFILQKVCFICFLVPCFSNLQLYSLLIIAPPLPPPPPPLDTVLRKPKDVWILWARNKVTDFAWAG